MSSENKGHSCLDVTSGSCNGAEICGLVGIYLLSLLANIIDKNNSGLYLGDGLILLYNVNGQKCIVKNRNFKIEIQTHLKVSSFLDVTFSLVNGTYRPYKKPIDSLLYINTSSNHYPQVIKQLPTSIKERLSKIKSSKEVFSASKYEYKTALNSSYQQTELIFNKKEQSKQE